MTDQALLLVNAFRWSAVALGVPSMLGTVGFGLLSLVMWWQRTSSNTGTDAKVSDSLVNVLVVAAGWVAKVLGALIGLAEGLIRIAAIGSLCGLVFAGLLWVTSRGLAVNAVWARGLAGVLLLFILLMGFIACVSSVGGLVRLGGLGLAMLSGYSIWMIWRGFA